MKKNNPKTHINPKINFKKPSHQNHCSYDSKNDSSNREEIGDLVAAQTCID